MEGKLSPTTPEAWERGEYTKSNAIKKPAQVDNAKSGRARDSRRKTKKSKTKGIVEKQKKYTSMIWWKEKKEKHFNYTSLQYPSYLSSKFIIVFSHFSPLIHLSSNLDTKGISGLVGSDQAPLSFPSNFVPQQSSAASPQFPITFCPQTKTREVYLAWEDIVEIFKTEFILRQ